MESGCETLLSLEPLCQMADYLTIYKIIHKQMGISLQDAGLNLSTSNTRGGEGVVSGCFNIVTLPSPCRFTLNSEQRHRGARSLPTDLL